MRKLRMLAGLLALLLLAMLVSACDSGKTPETSGTKSTVTTGTPEESTEEMPATTERPTSATTERVEMTTQPEDPLADYLVLIPAQGDDKGALIIPDDMTVGLQAPMNALLSNVADLMGEELYTDYESSMDTYSAEVVLCGTRGDARAEALLSEMDDLECRVVVLGDRVYLLSNTLSKQTATALAEDFVSLLERRDGALVISRAAASRSWVIPTFESAAGTLAGGQAYTTSDNNFQYTYENVTREEALAYGEVLLSEGYELYDQNTIGQVEFYFYRNNNDLMIIQYNNAASFVKIGFSHGDFIPPTEEETYETLVQPSIANLLRLERSGLGLIIQLSDGSYIILDGGYMGALAGNEAGRADRDALYNYLVQNKPASHEKPIISAWLLTHAHGDHDDAITAVLDAYGDDLEVRMFAHHFPDFKRQPCSGDVEGQGDSYYGAITLQMIRQYCPDATEWIVRTGQTLKIAGAEIEIMYTVEDLWPIQARWMNDTNTTYRVTIDGVDLMLLGDSDSYANHQMEQYYGEELQAEVLQLAHHSYNGETLQYELIDPKICFWAQFSYAAATRPCNQYLLQTRWVRTAADGTTVNGLRHHFYNDANSRVYIRDIK